MTPDKINKKGDDKIKIYVYADNAIIEKCPKCGNNTHFNIHSQQVAIDTCNIWAECKCGYDPTEKNLDRYENVWGAINVETAKMAIMCWNDAIVEGSTLD